METARAEWEAEYGPFLVFQKTFVQPGTYLHATQNIFDIRLPQGLAPEQADRLLNEKMRSYFEDRWAHRPLVSLKGISPLDAVGHPKLRRKVAGLILLLEQLLQTFQTKLPYTMDELRHKLGLDQAVPVDAASAGDANAITGMNAAELAALTPETLSEEDLKAAFTSAKRLDANELATKFAQSLVAKAASLPDFDGFIYDQHIVFQLLGEDRVERAYVSILKAIERDAKNNAGKRSIDYRKLRFKVLLAGKRIAEARIDIDKLLSEKGEDLDIFVFATEELLRFGQKDLASKYAGMGKLIAAKKSDRDRFSFFEEIQKRYGGEGKPA